VKSHRKVGAKKAPPSVGKRTDKKAAAGKSKAGKKSSSQNALAALQERGADHPVRDTDPRIPFSTGDRNRDVGGPRVAPRRG
jgi:hypothetical protein